MKKMKIIDLVGEIFSGDWGESVENFDFEKAKKPFERVFVIRTANFRNNGKIDYSSTVERVIETKSVEAKKLRFGDIIIEKSGGSPNQPVGRVVYFDLETRETLISNNFTAVIRPKANITTKFLFYTLFQLHNSGQTKKYQSKTIGILNLRLTDYLQEEILLPSLETQNKIVAILDRTHILIQKRQQTMEILDHLVKAVFFDMFGDPQLNQKKLHKIKLSLLTSCFKYGTSKKSEENKNAGVPIIRIPNIQNGEVNFLDLKYTRLTDIELDSLKLQHGDLLFVRTNGNPDYIAKCAVYNKENNVIYAFASYLLRVRLKENSKILPEIICDVVNSKNYRKRIIRETRTSAGNYNINIGGLKSFSVICPDMELQKEYVRIKHAIQVTRKHSSNSLKTIETLFQSLLQKAFKGELEFEKEKILEDILPSLKVEELLTDIKLLKALLKKLQKNDFKTGINYKMAQNLLFQLLDNEKSGLFQKCDVETGNLEIQHEAS